MTSTFDTVAEILQKDFHIEPAQLRPGMSLGELALDSLEMMEFVFALEDRFGQRIPEDRLDPGELGLSLERLCQVIDALREEPVKPLRRAA